LDSIPKMFLSTWIFTCMRVIAVMARLMALAPQFGLWEWIQICFISCVYTGNGQVAIPRPENLYSGRRICCV
jgi:hypothetical protein